MNVLLCRPQGSILGARASAAAGGKSRRSGAESAKPSLAASPSPVLSHSVEEKRSSLPLPLPIQLSIPQGAVKFPSPLKFLWFHRENSLEKEISEKEEEKKDEEREALPLTSGDEGSREEESSSGVKDRLRSWVPNLVNLAYLQSKYASFGFPRTSEEARDHHHVRVPGLCHDCGCDVCEGDHYLQSEAKLKKSVMRFEVPVVHDKESIREFLHSVPYTDLQFIARMANLADRAYYISEIKKDELLKHYGLRLVTSSLERKAAKEKAAVLEAAKEKLSGSGSDGVDSEVKTEDSEAEIKAKASDEKLGPAKAMASYLAFQTKSFLPAFKGSAAVPDQKKEESVAIANLASDDDEEEFFRYLELDSAYVDENSEKNLAADEEEVLSKVASSSEADSSVKSENLVAGAAVASAGLVAAGDEAKDAVAEELQLEAACPSEWYVCDEDDTHTRYFVIQGSDSLASWQANLLFESSLFEDPEWGVMVHRGFYEAAKGLYKQLMPLIQAHVDRFGAKAKFYFTGHSLGGSLSTLLTLMLRHRGVLPLSALLPVYTFGSPSIMCGGDWLLEKLGFPLNHIRSVVMHYDIVPRSFACHYPDQVVEVLKRLNATFRKHACLEQQKLMYATMGKMLIVQPDEQQAPHHPLLPAGGALYEVRHPRHDVYPETLKDPHSQTMAMVKEVRSAERSFLNTPHPLEILADPASYGSEGTISRDHDCDSYVRAVNAALKVEFRRWRRDRERIRSLPSLKRSKSGKRSHSPRPAAKESATESSSIKFQRSHSFSDNLEENGASRRDVAASETQIESLNR